MIRKEKVICFWKAVLQPEICGRAGGCLFLLSSQPLPLQEVSFWHPPGSHPQEENILTGSEACWGAASKLAVF
jgi:hypothetical protein